MSHTSSYYSYAGLLNQAVNFSKPKPASLSPRLWHLLGSEMFASQVVQWLKNLPANAGDSGLIPGSERFPGVGNDNPLQYSCLGNPWRGIWWATIYGVAKSRAWLSNRARRHADLICRWGNEWGKEWMDVDGSMTLAITFFEALLTKMSPLRSVTQDRFPFSWSWGHGLWRWEISKWRQSTFLLEILHWAGESKG